MQIQGAHRHAPGWSGLQRPLLHSTGTCLHTTCEGVRRILFQGPGVYPRINSLEPRHPTLGSGISTLQPGGPGAPADDIGRRLIDAGVCLPDHWVGT